MLAKRVLGAFYVIKLENDMTDLSERCSVIFYACIGLYDYYPTHKI